MTAGVAFSPWHTRLPLCFLPLGRNEVGVFLVFTLPLPNTHPCPPSREGEEGPRHSSAMSVTVSS